MLAVVYYGKENIQIMELPQPEPADHEVIVRVASNGICGSDMTIYAGKHPRAKPPLVPGHEIFGRIEKLGANVDASWKAGTRVAICPLISCGQCETCREGNAHVCERLGLIGIDTDGGCAEFVKVKAEQLVAIPDGVRDDQAAFVEPLAVAVHAIRESGFRPADIVPVTGGGPIGNLLAQVARASGAREVLVSEVKDFRRQLLARIGFLTFNPETERAADALQRFIGRRSVDIVFEATGVAGAYKDAVHCCKIRGEVVFTGIPKAPPEIDVLGIVYKEIRTTSARVYRVRDYLGAIKLLERGAVDTDPLITRIPLANAIEGFERMKAGDGCLKVLLTP